MPAAQQCPPSSGDEKAELPGLHATIYEMKQWMPVSRSTPNRTAPHTPVHNAFDGPMQAGADLNLSLTTSLVHLHSRAEPLLRHCYTDVSTGPMGMRNQPSSELEIRK